MSRRRFELVFAGGTRRRYRRWHRTLASAFDTAHDVLHNMDNGDPSDEPRRAHPAIVYGPGLPSSGMTVS